MLEFDEVAHVYRVDGRVVPHVTGVLRSALGDPFARVPPAVLERKRQIGTAAHLACHLDDAGELDEVTVHPDVLPYLEAWRAFRRETRCEVLMSERYLYHAAFGYAGTLDRVVLIDGKRAVVDIKTGLPGELAGLQTAAYAMLVDSSFGPSDTPMLRFALQALPNGRYRFPPYKEPGDYRDFLSALNVFRIKERLAA